LSELRVKGEHKVLGRGASTDVIEASARAYVDGLNKLRSIERRLAAAREFARLNI
jgi:hypothetical protein